MTTSITGPSSSASGGADRDLEAGTTVGEYVIEAQLGAGGFGTVYRATHPLIGKQVAIKVLARKYSADEDMVSRFSAEARAVNQIRHRNIIDIFSFGALEDGRAYYVMELLEGEPLDKVLDARGRIPLDEAVPILKAIAKALDAAHAKSIAHRDLKPENIFLARDSEGERYPKLLDFGIAKLLGPENTTKHKTATGAPIGTPYYMSPEQCRGKDVDHRTDIYSLGVVAYRLLTGEYPFDADGYLEIMMKQISEEAVPPSSIAPELPPSVDAGIARMMRKDPAQRPASCAAGIAGLVDGAAITPPILSSVTPPRLSAPRSAAAISGMAATQVSDALAATIAPTTQPPPSSAPKRTALWLGLAALGVGGAAVAVVLAMRGSDEPKQPPPEPKPPIAAPPPPIDAAVAPAIAIDAASKDIVVTVDGAPEGTEVRIGASPIGVVPAVAVPRGTNPVVLSFYADGYLPMSITITPDKDQRAPVTLKKKKSGSGGNRPVNPQPDPDDRDAIPDPFKKKGN